VYEWVICYSLVIIVRMLVAVLMLVQFGRTEIIQNTLNPDFVRKFVMDYFFEESQKLKFELWGSVDENLVMWQNQFSTENFFIIILKK